jgi:hypothetical protein
MRRDRWRGENGRRQSQRIAVDSSSDRSGRCGKRHESPSQGCTRGRSEHGADRFFAKSVGEDRVGDLFDRYRDAAVLRWWGRLYSQLDGLNLIRTVVTRNDDGIDLRGRGEDRGCDTPGIGGVGCRNLPRSGREADDFVGHRFATAVEQQGLHHGRCTRGEIQGLSRDAGKDHGVAGLDRRGIQCLIFRADER